MYGNMKRKCYYFRQKASRVFEFSFEKGSEIQIKEN